MNPSNTSGFPAYMGWARPSGVRCTLRATAISRPRGFLATSPPAATAAICTPQQLPYWGRPTSKTRRQNSICRITRGSSL